MSNDFRTMRAEFIRLWKCLNVSIMDFDDAVFSHENPCTIKLVNSDGHVKPITLTVMNDFEDTRECAVRFFVEILEHIHQGQVRKDFVFACEECKKAISSTILSTDGQSMH